MYESLVLIKNVVGETAARPIVKLIHTVDPLVPVCYYRNADYKQ